MNENAAEENALAEALCREYHPMHWDAAYGNRTRACWACKVHTASLVASGWRFTGLEVSER